VLGIEGPPARISFNVPRQNGHIAKLRIVQYPNCSHITRPLRSQLWLVRGRNCGSRPRLLRFTLGCCILDTRLEQETPTRAEERNCQITANCHQRENTCIPTPFCWHRSALAIDPLRRASSSVHSQGPGSKDPDPRNPDPRTRTQGPGPKDQDPGPGSRTGDQTGIRTGIKDARCGSRMGRMRARKGAPAVRQGDWAPRRPALAQPPPSLRGRACALQGRATRLIGRVAAHAAAGRHSGRM
jgi:hypothetical protein